MEIFVDFGMFELLAALGLAALGKAIYKRPRLAFAFLAASVLSPLILIFVVLGELPRWLAAIALGTALVNAAVIFSAQRAGRLLEKQHEQIRTPLVEAAGTPHSQAHPHATGGHTRP